MKETLTEGTEPVSYSGIWYDKFKRPGQVVGLSRNR